MEKCLVNAESYHPSLLIDPTKEKSPPLPPIEPVKNVKLSVEKKEEVKPRIEEAKPVETKSAEVKTVLEKNTETKTASEPPTMVTQQSQQETVNHTPTTITAPPSTKNLRVASNLPPHLEQQLQQHSMMRNTAPRQQQQGAGGHSGIRMVRSGSGAAWRAANQQQQILQRSASHPSSGEQRPQQQTILGIRMANSVQQIRGQANQVPQSASSNQPQTVQLQAVQQQLPGMVRQVRLVNAAQTQQLVQSIAPSDQIRPNDATMHQRGQVANSGNFQSQHRPPVPNSPQTVKMVIAHQQPDGKPINHIQQTPASPHVNQQPQHPNHFPQNGQQMQQTVQSSGQVPAQQLQFQQVTEENANGTISTNSNQQLRQSQSVDGTYVQVQNNVYPQQQQRQNIRLPGATNIQQQGIQGAQQQVIIADMLPFFIFYIPFSISPKSKEHRSRSSTCYNVQYI